MHKYQRGQIIPIFAIFATLLVALAALALDGSSDTALRLKLQDAAHAAASSAAYSWGKTVPALPLNASNALSAAQTAQAISALNGINTVQANICTITNSSSQYDVLFLDKGSGASSASSVAACEALAPAAGWQYALEVQIPPIATPSNPTPSTCNPTYECVGVIGSEKVWQYFSGLLSGASGSVAAGSSAWDGIASASTVTTRQITSGTTATQSATSCIAATSPVVCWFAGNSGNLHVWQGNQAATAIASGSTKALYGVSCATTSQCFASGAAGTILSITNASNPNTASVTAVGTATHDLGAISCKFNGTKCLAVDAGGFWVPYVSGTGWGAEVSDGATNALHGVSCWADGACLAVGDNGLVAYTSDNGTTHTDTVDGTYTLNAISCVDSTHCWMVGNGGLIQYTSNPTVNPPTWSTQTSNTGANLYGISCPTTTFCEAVGANGTLLQSTTPTTGGWVIMGANTGDDLDGVSCPDATFCSESGSNGDSHDTGSAPTVTSVSPTSGSTAGGTSVTITGTNFDSAYAVKFGTVAASSYTVNSSTSITATSPAESAATVDITVSTTFGTSATSAADQFQFKAGYSSQILSNTPQDYYRVNEASGTTAADTSGNSNSGTYAGTVTLGAAGLLANDSDTAVTLDGSTGWLHRNTTIAAAPNVYTQELWLKTTTASGGVLMSYEDCANPTGCTNYDRLIWMDNTGHVVMGTCPGIFCTAKTVTSTAALNDGKAHLIDATLSSAGMCLYVDSVLQGGACNTASTSGGPTGSNFTIHVGAGSINKSGTIWPDRPTSAFFQGTVDEVAVYTTALSAAAISANYKAAYGTPTVTSVSPNSGTTAGGTSVTITGTNLNGTTAVNFGATAATSYTVNSATQITATSPAGSTGTVDITVTTPGGTSTTGASDQFTYTGPPPTVTGVSPSSGPAGTSVTITGTNFTGATEVDFGACIQSTFTVNSATQIRTTSPAGGNGLVDVTVFTPGGTSATNASDKYNYGVNTPTC